MSNLHRKPFLKGDQNTRSIKIPTEYLRETLFSIIIRPRVESGKEREMRPRGKTKSFFNCNERIGALPNEMHNA